MNKSKQQQMAEKIRAQYTEKEVTELDELRALDERVRRPVNIFAYVFGAISAIIMGAGMSLVMTDIGSALGMADPMVLGIVIGVVGMIMALLCYPIYSRMLEARKKKYGAEILALSDKMINK